MKKAFLNTIIFLFVSNLFAQNQIDIEFNCTNGTMDLIKIESASDTEKIKAFKKKQGLYIDVDINNKSQNFISDIEQHFRTESVEIDTLNIGYESDWEYFTAEQKLKVAKLKREQAKKYADEIHEETNQGQQIVSLVNSNNREIQIPSIDGVPAIVLQAKNNNDEWKTIRYIYFNWCGNSYSYNIIPKKNKLDIIVELPTKGEYATNLRFKMFYNDNFVYSNEFEYTISQCDFIEKKIFDDNCINCEPNASNKLEEKPRHW